MREADLWPMMEALCSEGCRLKRMRSSSCSAPEHVLASSCTRGYPSGLQL